MEKRFGIRVFQKIKNGSEFLEKCWAGLSVFLSFLGSLKTAGFEGSVRFGSINTLMCVDFDKFFFRRLDLVHKKTYPHRILLPLIWKGNLGKKGFMEKD